LQRQFLDALAASEHSTDAMRRTMGDVYAKCQKKGFASLDETAFERLADGLRKLGMFAQADVVLQRAVAQFPHSRRLRYYLAETLGSLGRYDDAEVQYTTLLKGLPHD
jgi:predicted Zn-dependent protease